MKGKTKSGFQFNIDERILEDWRVIDAIGLSESADASEQLQGARKLVDLILGTEKQKLYDFLTERNNGFVPTTEVVKIVTEIITESKELKNSQSSEG